MKKKAVKKSESKKEAEQLSVANRLLFSQLGAGGPGQVELVKQLLLEEDVSPDSVNSKGVVA